MLSFAAANDWNPTESYGYDRPVSVITLIVQILANVGTGGQLASTVEGGNVVLTYTSQPLRDDSVRHIRLRLELHEVVDGKYVVAHAGEQYICQGGRGQQEFAPALCL